MEVGLLPTPPFWFAMAIVFIFSVLFGMEVVTI